MEWPSGVARIASQPLLRVALLPVVAGGAWLTDGLLRWLLTGAALVLLPELLPELLPRLRARFGADALARGRRALPLAIVACASVVLLWPLVKGEPPATRDHAIHYFQTRVLLDDLLPEGRLSGWTDRFNHGFPFGEGYPTLGYLWVAFVHVISFGAIGLRHSYAWGLLALWSLVSWGTWQLAAAITRDVLTRARIECDHELVAAWAGALAALAWLLDPGASRLGGWNYLMFHGVWAQLLSCALWLAALVWTLRAMEHPSPRRLAIASGCIAGGLLGHPFGLLTWAIGGVAFAIAVVATPPGARSRACRLRTIAVVHVLGLALAAGGLATFFAAAGELGRSPVGWSGLGALAIRLLSGELFEGPWAWASGGFAIGLALALWSGRTAAWMVALACVAMLLVGSQDGITVLRLDLLIAAFKNLQFPRFAIGLKPPMFALTGTACACAAAWIRAAIRRTAPADPGLPVSWLRRVIVAALLAPLVASALERGGLLVHRPVGAVDTLAHSGAEAEEAALASALRDEATATPQMRVAFLRTGMGGGTYPLFSIADAGAAAVLDGHVATVNFEWQITRRSVAVLRRLGVTHVIHDRPLDDADEALADALVRIGEYGSYTLERFTLAPDTAPRFVIGGGEIHAFERTRDSVRVEVSSPAGGRLTLAQAPSQRWQATLDGEAIETTTASVSSGMDLLAFELDRPLEHAVIELHYLRTRGEVVLPWVSAIALVLALAMLLRGTALAPPTAAIVGPRVRALAPWIAIGLAVLGVGALARRQASQLATTWQSFAQERYFEHGRGPRSSFVTDLVIRGDLQLEQGERRLCDGLTGKDALVDCDEADHRAHTSFTYADPYLFRCLAFGVAPGDTVTVRLGAAGDEVIAFLARHGGDTRSRQIEWSTGGKRHPLTGRRADFRFLPRDFEGGAVLEVTNTGDDLEDVCLAAARFH